MDTDSEHTPSPEPGALYEVAGDDFDQQSMSPRLNDATTDPLPPPPPQLDQYQLPQPDPYHHYNPASVPPYSSAPPRYASGVSDYFNSPTVESMSMDPHQQQQQQQLGPGPGPRAYPGHAVLSRPLDEREHEPQLVDSIDGTPYPAASTSQPQPQQPQQPQMTITYQARRGEGGEALERLLQEFWTRQVRAAEDESQWPVPATDWYKHPTLPLARIKKVMKSDPDVKMIGSDAPVLFAKACEMFITEVTSRAWLVAAQNKRRTLSRVYVAKALAMSDQFDFLIDIVPREVQNERGRNAAKNATEGGDDGEEDGDEDGGGGGEAAAAGYGGEEGDVDGEGGGGAVGEQDYDHDGEALDEGEQETEAKAE